MPRTDHFMSFDPFAGMEPRDGTEHHDQHVCDNGCGKSVENLGQWCDLCIVSNAQTCGDWDDEATEAAERIGVKP